MSKNVKVKNSYYFLLSHLSLNDARITIWQIASQSELKIKICLGIRKIGFCGSVVFRRLMQSKNPMTAFRFRFLRSSCNRETAIRWVWPPMLSKSIIPDHMARSSRTEKNNSAPSPVNRSECQ